MFIHTEDSAQVIIVASHMVMKALVPVRWLASAVPSMPAQPADKPDLPKFMGRKVTTLLGAPAA